MFNSTISVKKILFPAGIALTIMGFLAGIVLGQNRSKTDSSKTSVTSTSQSTGGDDMASMHAPAAPADNAKFQSLVGKPAPNFELTSFDGRNIKLSALKGRKVVIFFSEGAMCAPSCWDQMKSFASDAYFKDNGVDVLTIVVDDQATWAGAVNQDIKLNGATVLLDTDKKVSEIYGALTVDSSMHRGSYPGHSYVVINKEGFIEKVFDDPNMRVNNFEIIETLKKVS